MHDVSIPNLFIVLILLAGIILLQVYLSRKDSKLPGLILPALTFIISVLRVLGWAYPPDTATAQIVTQMIMGFLVSNIPTAVLLVIFIVCRKRFV